MVRTKFRLNSYTTSIQAEWPDGDMSKPTVKTEMRTLNFTPVCSGSEENKAFWRWTPSGSVQLGTVNQEAWKHFEIGKDYYLDFTPAP